MWRWGCRCYGAGWWGLAARAVWVRLGLLTHQGLFLRQACLSSNEAQGGGVRMLVHLAEVVLQDFQLLCCEVLWLLCGHFLSVQGKGLRKKASGREGLLPVPQAGSTAGCPCPLLGCWRCQGGGPAQFLTHSSSLEFPGWL